MTEEYIYRSIRSSGSSVLRVREIAMTLINSPDSKIIIWSQKSDYPNHLIDVADKMGFVLELTIPKKRGDDYTSIVHSIRVKNNLNKVIVI